MYDCITEQSESDAQTSYPITRRIWEGSSEFCSSIIIADSEAFGRMLFLDGELQSASADEHIYHETLVHPVMASATFSGSTGQGKRVLVVGGGEGATVREVLKWSPSLVDWVDIDRVLVHLCDEHLKWAPDVLLHPSVHYQGRDIREALPTLGRYDVIILDLPDPDGDTGYLYSDEFMQDLRGHLHDGYIVTHCGPVRPFGNIGEGFQRLLPQFGRGGFYSQMIPSFQSEWGFMIWPADKFAASCISELPPEPDLRVANAEQLNLWRRRTKLWLTALTQC